MNLGLKDCKAFIAGASKGPGKACAKALADEGARVFICARNKQALKQAASEFGAAGYSAADVYYRIGRSGLPCHQCRRSANRSLRKG